ncbi:MAG TPA: hypothetical protein VFS25_10050 [Chitinophaga sp.]|uniref:hypothetical protein n=1 Tax=Chitinophaga sp. TaxID=1869181 RepID=UPI002DB5C27B|nr:hypothetical protein [Chitinophaga sp.]HEU4553167.1 hypothetical protein [Chitinophaga sp.]
MTRKPFILTLAAATVLGAVLVSSCRKEGQPTVDRSVSATQIIPSNPTLSGVLGTNHGTKDTIHLTSAVAWHLSGLVYVDSSDVLIIDPGTVIRGDLSTSSSVPGGGLVITRGAKIIAQGQPCSPIIFTSAATAPASGDWSGVVILGNASTNHSGRVQVEGIPSNPPADATFGGTVGTNDADNSGILKYVRIEYAGYELSTDNEINGLTLAGVGSGTTLDYIEVFKSKDDAFEFFGGTVSASHLIAVDALDDMFDTDNGYNGTIRYALGLADTTRADKSQSNGFESDNNATGTTTSRITHPKYRYITIVGLPNAARAGISNGAPSGTGLYGRGAQLRRNAEFDIDSCIYMGYKFGVSLDSALGGTRDKYYSGVSLLKHSFVHAYNKPYVTESNGNPVTTVGFNVAANQFTIFATSAANGNQGFTTANPNANIALANPFTRPATGTSAANWIPGALASSRFVGAFPNRVDWTTSTCGWLRWK